MNKKDAIETFKAGSSVIYNGIEYPYISAIIYRRGLCGIYARLELMDRNGRDVVIVDPKRVTEMEP